MGSISDIFEVFTGAIFGFIDAGSAAGDVANIVTGSIGLPSIGVEG